MNCSSKSQVQYLQTECVKLQSEQYAHVESQNYPENISMVVFNFTPAKTRLSRKLPYELESKQSRCLAEDLYKCVCECGHGMKVYWAGSTLRNPVTSAIDFIRFNMDL